MRYAVAAKPIVGGKLRRIYPTRTNTPRWNRRQAASATWSEAGIAKARRWAKAKRYRLRIIPVAKYPNSTHFSPNYTRREFACLDRFTGLIYPVPAHLEGNAVRLANALEAMSRVLGRKVRVRNAYRTPAYNRKVNGARFSQHMQATAADLINDGWSQNQLVAAAKKVDALRGIGIYPSGNVHVDVRRTVRTFWNDWVGYR